MLVSTLENADLLKSALAARCVSMLQHAKDPLPVDLGCSLCLFLLMAAVVERDHVELLLLTISQCLHSEKTLLAPQSFRFLKDHLLQVRSMLLVCLVMCCSSFSSLRQNLCRFLNNNDRELSACAIEYLSSRSHPSQSSELLPIQYVLDEHESRWVWRLTAAMC